MVDFLGLGLGVMLLGKKAGGPGPGVRAGREGDEPDPRERLEGRRGWHGKGRGSPALVPGPPPPLAACLDFSALPFPSTEKWGHTWRISVTGLSR